MYRKFGWVSEENNRFAYKAVNSHASSITGILIRLPNPLRLPTYSCKGRNNFKDGFYINTRQLCLCVNGFLGLQFWKKETRRKYTYGRKTRILDRVAWGDGGNRK
jgi:hypothetical protein